MLTLGVWVLIVLFVVVNKEKLSPLFATAGKILKVPIWLGIGAAYIYGWHWVASEEGWTSTTQWIGGIILVPMLFLGTVSAIHDMQKQVKLSPEERHRLRVEINRENFKMLQRCLLVVLILIFVVWILHYFNVR